MYASPCRSAVHGLREYRKGDHELGAAFQQNSLQRVKPGDDAEVAFDAVPGRIFRAKVRIVVAAIRAGQLRGAFGLIEPDRPWPADAGRAVAIIDVTDDMSDYQIPRGSTAQVAILTSTGITWRCCGASCCACGAGRIMSSSRGTRKNPSGAPITRSSGGQCCHQLTEPVMDRGAAPSRPFRPGRRRTPGLAGCD